MRKASLAVLLCWALSVPVSGADISGKWAFSVELDMGGGNPVFTFQQEGEKLTGTYSGAAGKADLTGSVKGDQVEWKFTAQYQGMTFDVVIRPAAATIPPATTSFRPVSILRPAYCWPLSFGDWGPVLI